MDTHTKKTFIFCPPEKNNTVKWKHTMGRTVALQSKSVKKKQQQQPDREGEKTTVLSTNSEHRFLSTYGPA